jgi:hypothetical protein
MFEDYLQDAYEFLSVAEIRRKESKDREARRYYRASVFYAAGAIESFVNYLADSFAKAETMTPHEICFLNDKVLIFSARKGLIERISYSRVDEKIRFLMGKFVSSCDFDSLTWVRFMEFKTLRDSLVHPRQMEDDTSLAEYHKKVRSGLKAIIEIMSSISSGMFGSPLRKQLLDLIPDESS